MGQIMEQDPKPSQVVPRPAEVHLLSTGYVAEYAAGLRVASTVSFVADVDSLIVIDPGMVSDQSSILGPLKGLAVDPAEVTDVILSHHHPDHTINAGLFPNASIHDYWAIYKRDMWIDRAAEGTQLSPAVRLIATPGHTPQDITTLVSTAEDVVAFTHLWWTAEGPEIDPRATDMEAIRANRVRVLEVATLIVPAHGAPFRPR